MIIDMHLHTTKGGSDSSLTPKEMVEHARRLGLDGVCVTEHTGIWDPADSRRVSAESGLLVIRGLEVSTDLGHVAVFGLPRYVGGMHRIKELRGLLDLVGGFAIAVHPFRRLFDTNHTLRKQDRQPPPTLEQAANLPLFDYVDEMEVLNGACTEHENLFGLLVARKLGWHGTAGSDAHSTHGMGCFVTVFERDMKNEEDFITELRAGRFHPARGFLDGDLVPYTTADYEYLLQDPRLAELI